MQNLVLIVTLSGIGWVATVFVYVICHSNVRESDYERIAARAYRVRYWWFWSLCVLGVWVSFVSLSPFPLSVGAVETSRVIRAVGAEWVWRLDADSARVGESVAFHVTSDDVNHGFALYDPHGKLIAQTQAMPGYVNVLPVTFREPGEYRILCLEYCGLAHHGMIGTVTVQVEESES